MGNEWWGIPGKKLHYRVQKLRSRTVQMLVEL